MIQIDRNTVIQVLGCLMLKPDFLSDTDKFRFEISDFPQQLDKFIFSAIYNLYVGGAELIHTIDIDNYLKTNDSARLLIEQENGIQFLQDCETYAEVQNFTFYYNKLKKLNLIKDLQKAGHDVSNIYCEDPLDDNYDKINRKFETLTTTDIVNQLKGEVANYENRYVLNSVVEESTPVDGIRELIKDLAKTPEVGVRLQGEIYNTIVRGGRKGTLYLRSGSSGLGKTRAAVGDACQIAYPIRFEPSYGRWVATGTTEKVLYIMTEQDPAEIQTMILAYLTGYNEELFLYGNYTEEHMERINKAIEIMEKYKDNFLFARIPDPCASVIKNLFRRYNLQYGVENFFFDYIFLSTAMLNEYRDLKLQPHDCLRIFTTTLKNLAIELNSFVSTSTQVSEQENDKKSSWKDYHNISGARAIAHLVDFGCIMSRPTQEELKQVEGFSKLYNITPNVVTDVYKNRRGRWTMVRIWSYIDLGTLRRYDLFVTDINLKPLEEFQIVDFVEEKTSEMTELENYLNNGAVSNEKAIEILENLKDVNEVNQELANSLSEAFGTLNERRTRVHNIDIGDMI